MMRMGVGVRAGLCSPIHASVFDTADSTPLPLLARSVERLIVSMAIEGLHRVWPTKLQANTALLLYAGSEHRSGLVCNCKTARCDGVASGSVLCLKMEKLVS
jgi:hypothetical protein